MAQSLRLRVFGRIKPELVSEVARQINPAYLKTEIRRRGIPNHKCPECGTSTYQLTKAYSGIPTSDGTLRLDSRGYWGNATGEEQREKLIVKAVALRGIQRILADFGLKSRMDFSDLDPANRSVLYLYGLV